MTEEDWDKVCPQLPLSFLIHTVASGLDMWYDIVLGGKCQGRSPSPAGSSTDFQRK